MTVTDSHCHLDDKKFDVDIDAVLDRAARAGVIRMLTIGTGDGPPVLDCAVRLAEKYEPLFASIGVHPHDAAKAGPRTLDDLRSLGDHAKVVAFGEIGLDYHYDFSPREAQREIFRAQLDLASELSLPIIIHTREAWADTTAILRERWSGPGIMHCFTGTVEQARECIDLGFYLGFGGVSTFPRAAAVREAAAIVPPDRLLLETDSPYLAPVPFRGKRNEPSYVLHTARVIADARGVSFDDLAEQTTANFERIFVDRIH